MMPFIVNSVMLISFVNGAWWLSASVTGSFIAKLLIKSVLGFGGLLLPSIYFLKLFGII